MDFGNSLETTLTERIMARIQPHLKQEPPPQESHHYNRVYEAIHRTLSESLLDIMKTRPFKGSLR